MNRTHTYQSLLHLLLVSGIVLISGCNVTEVEKEKSEKPMPPDKMVLFATVFEKGQGIWTFNSSTLEVKDTIPNSGRPWTINFSSDYRTIYTAWRDSNTDKSHAYAIDIESEKVIKSQEIRNTNVQLDRSGTRLVSMGYNSGIQVLDAQTFEILFEGHMDIRELIAKMVASPVKDEIYALISENDESGLSGLMIFNTQTFSIENIIPLTDDISRMQGMDASYLDISPCGRFAYATVFSFDSWLGSFHVIDLENEEPIFEAPCGGYSWLGVSPDGRHVYISDPAGAAFRFGGLSYELEPTNLIRQYDVERREMDIFANGANDLGLSGGALITSAIAIAPDSRSMFIRVSGVKTDDGIFPGIIHVDTRSREIINLYTHTTDPDGYVRSLLHQLKIGYTSD